MFVFNYCNFFWFGAWILSHFDPCCCVDLIFCVGQELRIFFFGFIGSQSCWHWQFSLSLINRCSASPTNLCSSTNSLVLLLSDSSPYSSVCRLHPFGSFVLTSLDAANENAILGLLFGIFAMSSNCFIRCFNSSVSFCRLSSSAAAARSLCWCYFSNLFISLIWSILSFSCASLSSCKASSIIAFYSLSIRSSYSFFSFSCLISCGVPPGHWLHSMPIMIFGGLIVFSYAANLIPVFGSVFFQQMTELFASCRFGLSSLLFIFPICILLMH